MTNHGVSGIQCSNVRPGTTGAGGWDLDVTMEIDGSEIDGELTLLPAEQDGHTPTAWGSPDHWIEGRLIARLRDLDDAAFRRALGEIEAVAREAIVSSDVEPAAADSHE